MAMIPMEYDEGVQYLNRSNVIKEDFTASTSYTATKNGWIIGYIRSDATSTSSAFVTVDGAIIALANTLNGASQNEGVCAPVKAGQVIATSAAGTYSNLKFIGMQS